MYLCAGMRCLSVYIGVGYVCIGVGCMCVEVGCVGVYRGVVCVCVCVCVHWEVLSAVAIKGQSGRTDLIPSWTDSWVTGKDFETMKDMC